MNYTKLRQLSILGFNYTFWGQNKLKNTQSIVCQNTYSVFIVLGICNFQTLNPAMMRRHSFEIMINKTCLCVWVLVSKWVLQGRWNLGRGEGHCTGRTVALKVSRSRKKIVKLWLLPKNELMNLFFYPDDLDILETWISISSFKYFRVIRREKQIRSFVFWEKLRLDNYVSRSTDL